MSSDNCPLVSVVIPAYNAEKHIQEAVDSALMQSYSNLEVIVIDDGSIDKTLEVLTTYSDNEKVTTLHHENHKNLGVSQTRRLGVNQSRGEYIAFLDADDTFHNDKIKIQIDALERNPDAVLCHTAINVISEVEDCPSFEGNFNWSRSFQKYFYHNKNYFLKSNRICNSSVVVRADVIKNTPFSVPQLFQYEDWLTWILLADKGSFLYLPQKSINYRYHLQSSTFRVIKEHLIETFSRLELYLCVMAKSNKIKIRYRALMEIKSSLFTLYKIYRG